MSKEMRLILVDADSLTYQSSKETIQESIQVLDEKIQNMYEKTEATHAAFFIGQGRSFRKLLAHDYKNNRGKYQTSLKWLQFLKLYLKEKYSANSMELVESDDLVTYHFYNSNNPIICSPDKDILQAIPGRHLNYTYKLEEKGNPDSVIKGWWVNTTEGDALNFQLKQLIWGDASDNIITPFPENCANYLVESGIGLTEILEGYMNGFEYITPTGKKKFAEGYGTVKGIYEFQKNFRLLYMLRNDDDFMREIGIIPSPPNIIEVNKEIDLKEYYA